MEKNKSFLISFSIILTVGIVFLAIITFIYKISYIKEEDRIYTTATITRIDVTYQGDDNYDYDVYADVDINGKLVNKELNFYESSMHEGDIINVYYDKNNEDKINCEDEKIVYIVFYGIGGVFSSIGLIGIIITLISTIFIRRKMLNQNQ